jgi:NADH:ubiquinone oxidoreductase subunit E
VSDQYMLTAKQEGFAQSIASGLNQADAYRANYNAVNMKAETIQQAASRIAADSKVSARIASLKKALESKGLWTREKSVQALANIADGGEAKANEIVAAIKELNAMHGFNAPAKIEIGGELVHRIERVIVRS